MRILLPAAIGTAALGAALILNPGSGRARALPAPAKILPASGSSEIAYFAGGCFWGVEGVFEQVKGVDSAVSGYMGGIAARPDYRSVTSGRTGHAETVKVRFDPRQIRYADLLRIYFSVIADPTQLNRQGPDTGTQYRTALFPASKAQAEQARAYIAQLTRARAFRRPIVTRLEPLSKFTPAEAYHQDFMAKNPRHPYILMHDRPKVAAFRSGFPRFVR